MATKEINQLNAKKKIKQRSLRKSSARGHLQSMSQMKVVGSRNNCNRSKKSSFSLLRIPNYTALCNWLYFNLVVTEKLMINLRRAQKPLS